MAVGEPARYCTTWPCVKLVSDARVIVLSAELVLLIVKPPRVSGAVNEVGLMSRSNVMSIALAVVFRTRLSVLTAWPGMLVDTMCGPGMLSGRLSWLKLDGL